MELSPIGDEEWQRFETELSSYSLLNTPLDDDNLVSFGQRLQTHIDEASDELQFERAAVAKERIDEYFSDEYSRLMFLKTNWALVFHRSEDGKPGTALDFTDVAISGELKGVHIIETDKHYVVFEIGDASLYFEDSTDGTTRTYEPNSPTLVPICAIHNYELL